MFITKHFYPLFILLLLGSFLGFSTWAAKQAIDAKPQVTDADYYSKGLRYSSTLLEKRAATALGWAVSTQVTGHTLNFQLNDKQGRPVVAAKGFLSIFLPETSENKSLPLREIGLGRYQLTLSENITGEIAARIEFEQKGVRLNRQLLINL